jgi:hypothetical protein
MKNLLILATLLVFSLTNTTAQTIFKKGDVEFASGIGLLSTFAKDDAQMMMPPLSARLGLRLASNFSLSGYAAYSAYKAKNIALPNGSFKDVESEMFIAGLRAAVHANRMENWDIYGGAMLGYNMPTVRQTISDEKTAGGDGPTFSRPAENKMTYSAFVGASYFPIKNLGMFAELGYGISLFNMGIQWKL